MDSCPICDYRRLLRDAGPPWAYLLVAAGLAVLAAKLVVTPDPTAIDPATFRVNGTIATGTGLLLLAIGAWGLATHRNRVCPKCGVRCRLTGGPTEEMRSALAKGLRAGGERARARDHRGAGDPERGRPRRSEGETSPDP